MSFSNKVVIVTGASSGIGADTAVLFAKEGANVAIIGRNETNLKKTADKCTLNGNTALIIKADISKDDDCKMIIKETIDKYGKLDILVNNAGISKFSSVIHGNVMEVFDEIMKTNLRAVVLLTSLAAPYLIKTKGNIVNVSSIGGKHVQPFPIVIYSALKAALDHYSRGAALEFSAHGVRVNVVSPGPVWTGMVENVEPPVARDDFKKVTPLKRVMEGEEIGEIILFLSSDKAKGITGSDFVADNGTSLHTTPPTEMLNSIVALQSLQNNLPK